MNVIGDRERGSAEEDQGVGMSQGWTWKPLGEVCKTGSGGTPLSSRKEFYEGGTIPWLVSGEVAQGNVREAKNFITPAGLENSSAKLFPRDTVLVAMYGATAGQVGILRFEATTNQAVCGILPNDKFVPEFLYYLLLAKKDDLVAQATGNAQPNISQIKIKNTDVPVLPLPEQQRIVALLDEANAKRNLQSARAIFESHLQSVFSQRGEGWLETTIGETCTLKSGTTVSPALERPGGDFPYLKVADMSFEGNEDQITSSSRFLMRADIKESAVIPAGATIFPKRGGAIMTNKKRIAALPICADLNIMSVIPSQKISARLLYYYFLNVDMRKLGSGSSIPQINNYDVEPLEISFPESLATQDELIRVFDDLSAETQHLTRLYERKLTALEELKKSFLHQAFNGEL
jgi:type I restriction enzyme S subunit